MSDKKIKREEAEIRQAEYNNLSIDKKIELVKSRGGSVKELAKLEKQKAKLLNKSEKTEKK